jgi:hypothetical protein
VSGSVFALPVSVEQIATAIRQMDVRDRERLLDLVPELCPAASKQAGRTVRQARASVARLREEVVAAVATPLAPDEPFLGDLTLAQYHALSEDEKERLWDEWAGLDLIDLEEQEVRGDALPAG